MTRPWQHCVALVAFSLCISLPFAFSISSPYSSYNDKFVFPVGSKGRQDFLAAVDGVMEDSNCRDRLHLTRMALSVSQQQNSYLDVLSRRVAYVQTATSCRHDHADAHSHDWDLYEQWSRELEGNLFAHQYEEVIVKALKKEGRSIEALERLGRARHGRGDRTPDQLAQFLEFAGSLLLDTGNELAAVADFFGCLQADPTGPYANICLFHLLFTVQRIPWDENSGDAIPLSLSPSTPSTLRVRELVERATNMWLDSRSTAKHPIVGMAKLLSVWHTPVFASQLQEWPFNLFRRRLNSMLASIDDALRFASNEDPDPPFRTISYVASKGTSFGPFEVMLDNKCMFVRTSQCSETTTCSPSYRPFTQLLLEPNTYYAIEAELLVRPGQVWIIKSCDGADGEGIFLRRSEQLVEELAPLLRFGSWVVEAYMSRPLLLNGRKFDIKIPFALVGNAQVDCFGLLAFKDGKIRSSGAHYRHDDFDDVSIHLTNTAVRLSSNPEQGLEEPPVITIRDLSRVFGQSQWDVTWSRLKKALGQTISGARKSDLWRKTSSNLAHLLWPLVNVAMYTADVIISQDGDIWVLEVNASPGQQQPWTKWAELERNRAQSYLSLAKRTTELTAAALDSIENDTSVNIRDHNMLEHQLSVCKCVVDEVCHQATIWGFDHVPLH